MVMSLICAGATSEVSQLKSNINIILHVTQVILGKNKNYKSCSRRKTDVLSNRLSSLGQEIHVVC